jgi:sarcosine oxidase subunit alpha
MTYHRIEKHPILEIPVHKNATFSWNGKLLNGHENEMISSALIANGIHIFGHHAKDNSPQGIFCANGQCSQCLVIVDGLPVKACMTPLEHGMDIHSIEGRPVLPDSDEPVTGQPIPVLDTDVLIVGGGPAGISAALELGKKRIDVILVDDKDRLGGKLVLQTHKFFGSVADSYAGARGSDIAKILATEIKKHDSIRVWLNATAIGVFSDGIIGIVQRTAYRMIQPKRLLVAAGAREKMLSFPGNTLPGVYGAGAFQTLVNRDLVKAAHRVLIIGGGNVGLIAGYHAVQAGIEVVALIEALPAVSGYKVHADKLRRAGVPIYTHHTILEARGDEHVVSATIAGLDDRWHPVPGTEKTFAVDTVLVAAGLSQVNEFYLKAKEWGMDVFAAGDAQEIAEASAAMFSGKITGFSIAASLGYDMGRMPEDWKTKEHILKARPGSISKTRPRLKEEGCFPIFHCHQQIPCNPCTSVCPTHAIHTRGETITGLPFRDETIECTGCMNCVAVCPGLAITLVDFRKNREDPLVTLPYEIGQETVEKGQPVGITDVDGNILGYFPVEKMRRMKKYPKTLLVQVKLNKKLARQAVGIRVQKIPAEPETYYEKAATPDHAVICRCERVTAGEIRAHIQNGVVDMNQLKALTRAGMGSCGSKTCRPLIKKIFLDEGVDLAGVIDRTDRPLFVEVPMGCFAGIKGDKDNDAL